MDLPQIPLPIIGSILLCWLLLRAVWQGERRPAAPFLLLLALCAAQGVILTLAVGLNWPAARWLSPVTAAGVPVLAWLGFAAAQGAQRGARVLPHLGAVFVIILAAAFARPALDPLLVALFTGYGGAILWHLRGGSDALGALALDGGERPVWLWRTIAAALILSGLGDLAISAGFALGLGDLRGWLIGVNYTVFLAGIGALSLAFDPAPTPATAPEDPPPPATAPEDIARDAEIHARARALLTAERLFLDPGLTLARLARRLRLPEKTLSAAINRHAGQNVSRLVNDLRIDHACALIAAGCPVTEAMLESGFNTKSNFNRAFRIARATTPSAWRDGLARNGSTA